MKGYCGALPVSESGYYKCVRNRGRKTVVHALLEEIHRILDEHWDNRNYGVGRMRLALERRGIKKSYSTVKRVMQLGNLLHESRRRHGGLTRADRRAQRPGNIIRRDFTADRPDQKCLTDITEVQCSGARLYIAPIMDCCGGVVVCAMDTNMRKQLCIRAVREAWMNRTPESGGVCHSDEGSQYTSETYKKTLGRLHIVQSMSDVGKCYDNCRMESFFATLKKEKLYQMDTTNMTAEEVKRAV